MTSDNPETHERHIHCKCVSINRFGGEWGSPAAMELFKKLGKLQIESGIHNAWVTGILDMLQSLDFLAEEDSAARDALRAELPLGARVLEGSILIDELGENGSHAGYSYGLIKVNPFNGVTHGEALWVLDVTDSGEVYDADTEQFSPAQIDVIKDQIVTQTDLGLMIPDNYTRGLIASR